MIYIHNATLYTPSEIIKHGVVIISGETITAIGRQSELACLAGAQSVDAGGLILVPGFIDLQVNGGFGMDFATSPETIWLVGENLTRFGVPPSCLQSSLQSPEPSATPKRCSTRDHPQVTVGRLWLGCTWKVHT